MSRRMREISPYMPGAAFIILGFLVVFFPMLLVALFSAGLILIGITAVSIAHRLRKLQRTDEFSMDWGSEGSTFKREGFQRVFVHRRW